MLFQEQVRKVKQAAPKLAATTGEQRNAALTAVREALLQRISSGIETFEI